MSQCLVPPPPHPPWYGLKFPARPPCGMWAVVFGHSLILPLINQLILPLINLLIKVLISQTNGNPLKSNGIHWNSMKSIEKLEKSNGIHWNPLEIQGFPRKCSRPVQDHTMGRRGANTEHWIIYTYIYYVFWLWLFFSSFFSISFSGHEQAGSASHLDSKLTYVQIRLLLSSRWLYQDDLMKEYRPVIP